MSEDYLGAQKRAYPKKKALHKRERKKRQWNKMPRFPIVIFSRYVPQ